MGGVLNLGFLFYFENLVFRGDCGNVYSKKGRIELLYVENLNNWTAKNAFTPCPTVGYFSSQQLVVY